MIVGLKKVFEAASLFGVDCSIVHFVELYESVEVSREVIHFLKMVFPHFLCLLGLRSVYVGLWFSVGREKTVCCAFGL